MRRTLLLALVFPCLLGTNVSADEATPDDVATLVIDAQASGDMTRLLAIARTDEPDPWLVTDALLARGEAALAKTFAGLSKRPDTVALPTYVDAQRESAGADARRATADAAFRLVVSGDPAAALEAVTGLVTDTDDVTSVRVLSLRAEALVATGSREEGSATWLAAAGVAERIGWLRQTAAALYGGALDASYRGDYATALRTFIRQRDVEQQRENPVGVANALTNIGLVHWRLGRAGLALTLHARALEIHMEAGNRSGVALSHTHIGIVHRALGGHAQALDHQTQALALWRELGNQRGIADCLTNLANLHHDQNEYDQALALHEETLAIRKAMGDRRGIQLALANMGILHQALGDFDAAIDVQQQALDLAQALGDRLGIGRSLNSLGNVYQARGDAERAYALLIEAWSLFSAIGAERDAGRTASNLALAASDLARYDDAVAHLRQAIALLEPLGDRDGLARALSNLGAAYNRVGRAALALAAHDRALELARALPDRSLLAAVLNDAASAYLGVLRLDKAAVLLEEAFELQTELGEHDRAMGSAANLGGVWRQAGELERATAWLERALALADEHGGSAERRAGTLTNLALVLEETGRVDEAITRLEQVLASARERGDAYLEASTLGNLAHAELRKGRVRRTLGLRLEALQIAREIEASDLVVSNAWGAAGAQLLMRAPADALETAKDAIENHLVPLLSGLGDIESSTARDRWKGLFEVAAVAAMHLKRPDEAFRIIEMNRAGALVDALGMDALLAATVPPALRLAEAKARAAERSATLAYQDAKRSGKRAAVRDAREALSEARDARRDVMDRIEREARSSGETVLVRSDPLPDVQAILQKGDALVLCAVFEQRSIAVVVTKENAALGDLGPTPALEASVRALGLRDPDTEPGPALDQLREMLAIAVPKGATRVFVSPDGALVDAPFALVWPEVEVTYVPSARVLAHLATQLGHAPRTGVLALGDPKYAGTGLASLPASRAEAEAVGDEVLVGERATVRALEEALQRKEWRAVHLACHGLLDTERPRLSALALTAGADDDGRLTALEIFRMRVPADLVVLSACETASGAVSRTEGVSGLMRAFMHAGAPRVIGSLWKVDDAATQALMAKFYELWTGSTGAAAALKQAQAFVRSQERWRHPYYWAAWVIWGAP